MQKLYTIVLTALMVATLFSCDKWTDMEAKSYEPGPKSAEYYAALRAYKQSDHAISFGWYGGWTAEGVSLYSSLRSIPDSVDLVSIWGNWRNLTEVQKADLKFCKETKGTKFLMCFIIANIGDQLTPAEVTEGIPDNDKDAKRAAINAYWGWEDGNDASIEAAIKKYADMICDTIDKYNYDGFDIDYEPHYGAPGEIAGGKKPDGTDYVNRMDIFVKAIRERLGPDHLLVVDGEPQSMPAETGPLFDYFIVQAYQCSGDANLDSRLNSTIKNYSGILTPEQVAKKYIVTENFESYAQNGGISFTDRYGNKMQSLEGMARWTPIINDKKVEKGGVGTFHMEYEFLLDSSDPYKYLRKAIQIMNPANPQK